MDVTDGLIQVAVIAIGIWLFGIALGLWVSKRFYQAKPKKQKTTSKNEAIEQHTALAVSQLTTKVNQFLENAAVLKAALTHAEIEKIVNGIQADWKKANRGKTTFDVDLIAPIEIFSIRNGQAQVCYDREIEQYIKRLQ